MVYTTYNALCIRRTCTSYIRGKRLAVFLVCASLQREYQVTETVQSVGVTHSDWWYRGSSCADTHCFTQSVTSKASRINIATEYNWETYAVLVLTGPYCCKSNQKHLLCERWGRSTVNRWLKKICTGCKKLDDLARSSRPKTVDPEAVFQAVEANLPGSTRRD